MRDAQQAALALGLQIQVYNASTMPEIDTAFATLSREHADALFVAGDAFFVSRRSQFVIFDGARQGTGDLPGAMILSPGAG